MKKFKLFLIVFLLYPICPALAQYMGEEDEELQYPIYYKETKYALEHVTELPRDTIFINDTIFVSDLDGFFKQYGCTLTEFIEKYGHLKTMMDSLNDVTNERLYYNYFLPRDTSHLLSNRFFVKDFKVENDSVFEVANRNKDWDDFTFQKTLRKEILFRFEENAMQTDSFLLDKTAIIKVISKMFTLMSEKDSIKGINLFFPNYDFKQKRAMTQFIKSVRIIMDASKNFKYEKIRLNVTFVRKNEEKIDENFRYCLMQEANEVLFLDKSDTIDSCYIKGNRMTPSEMNEIRFFPQLMSHLYIARYYIGSMNIDSLNTTDFSEENIASIIALDYPENTWEMYLLILIVVFVVLIASVILYYTYIPFSTLINNNIESVLLIALVAIFEIVALIVSMFRHMCQSDVFSFVQNNSGLIFTLPLVMVLIIPFLNGIAKKRRTP